jgi:DNA polymerase-3 subunit epsilon
VNDALWILFCIDSAGPAAAPYAVEIAAQHMRGWSPEGDPFHRLLKPREGPVSGGSVLFSRPLETLERDGLLPDAVYREQIAYAGTAPWVAYGLDKQWDILRADWQRLEMQPPGERGFCAASLTQRLLDPLPAGNCKVEMLRQFYQLPARLPESALSQLQTLVDLLATVLRPIAETRGLHTWQQLVEFTLEPWFPSRITFGRFKGRLFYDALQDPELAKWLEWLAASSNEQSAAMGAWYLQRLKRFATGAGVAVPPGSAGSQSPTRGEDTAVAGDTGGGPEETVNDPAEERLKARVAQAKARLAELEAAYTIEKRAVETAQSLLFGVLRPYFHRRDKLALVVRYRRGFLDALLAGGEEEAETVAREGETAAQNTDAEYEQAAASLADRKALNEEEEEELKRLWRKLVGLFHPDRFALEPDKQEAYAQLTREINDARDKGDIERLREIVRDPEEFMAKMGLSQLNFANEQEVPGLEKLLNSLESMILSTLEALGILRKDPAYELHRLNERIPGFIEEAAKEQARRVEMEIEALEEEAVRLEREITELNGGSGAGI